MLGMTSVTFRRRSAEEIIELCRACGVEGIEWGGDVHVPPEDLSRAGQIGEATRKAGLRVLAYGSYFTLGRDGDAQFSPALAAAEALGAPRIRLWCGEKGSAKTNEAELLEYAAQLKRLCALAGERKITLACEFHKNTCNDGAESALRLIEAVGAPNYKTYWQTLSFDENDLLSLKRLREHIAEVHVFAWSRGGLRYPLARRRELWESYISVLQGRNVPFVLEFVRFDSVRSFKEDVRTLRELLEKQGEG